MIQPGSKVHEFAARVPAFWGIELNPCPAWSVSTGMIYLLMRGGKLRSRSLVRNGYQRGIRLIRRTDVEALCSPAQNQERPTSSNQAAKEKDRS